MPAHQLALTEQHRVTTWRCASPPRRSIRSWPPTRERALAVYAAPDDPVGDRVTVALERRGGAEFNPADFDAFLAEQPDLEPKWAPAFVRL